MNRQEAYVRACNLMSKNGEKEAALVAFKAIIRNYPGTSEAARSTKHLSALSAAPAPNVSMERPTPQSEPLGLELLLRSKGFAEYVPLFAANHIDMELFAGLSDDDLKEIGINSLGHRRLLMQITKSPVQTASINAKAPTTSAPAPVSHFTPAAPSAKPKVKPIAKGLARFGLGMLAGHLLGEVLDGGEDEIEGIGIDTDGDGYIDSIAMDTDGDGYIDSVAMDTDGDGYIDSVAMDTDGDGYIDRVGVDSTGDGRIDTVAADLDGDHDIDIIAIDTDGDGEADQFA